MKSVLLVLFALCANILYSQNKFNLSFENLNDNDQPIKWLLLKKNYKIDIDSMNKYAGSKSLKIVGENSGNVEFAVVSQILPKNVISGREVELTAKIKSNSNFDGAAFPYLKTMDENKKNVSFINLEEQPVTGNTEWKEVSIQLPILENVKSISFGMVFKGKGTAWFDDVKISIDGKPIEKELKNLTPQEISSIKQYIYPLKTFEPSDDDSDLKILKNLIGDAKVVALGESTHGTSEIYKMKDRLVRYFAKNESFDIFSIEAYMQQAYLVNNYTIDGTASLQDALQNLVFWVWKTEEMAGLLKWMKAYNNGAKKINFTGFDMQNASEPIKQLRKVFPNDNEMQQKIDKLSLIVQEFNMQNKGNKAEYILKKEQADVIYPILSEIKLKVNEKLKLSANDRSWQNQNIRIVEQLLQKSGTNRDKFMAENFLWIKEQNPESKFIICAHNGHISKHDGRMGSFLNDKLKDDYVTFGFAFFDGKYTAQKDKVLGSQTAQKPYLGTYEYWLNSLDVPYFILDMKRMKKDENLKWLISDLEFRSVGHTKIPQEFYNANISKDFDYLIFINKSTSSELVNK